MLIYIITIISTIALSIPVLLLGVFKFLLQVWFLALVIFTAIPLVLSLIPAYSESALNHGKKLVGVLLMKAGLVLLIAVITGLVTLLYESVKVTNGVEGYAFVVFLICITIWGLFKYRSEIFEVASAGMIQGQQVVERATTNSFDRMSDAGEQGLKGAKRMVGQAYRSHQHKKRQQEFQSSEDGTGRKTSANGAIASGGRSEHRKAVGENSPQKQRTETHHEQQANGKGAKSSAASMATGTAITRSASRDAGVAIVNLDDYKSGKSEGTDKGKGTSQAARNTHLNGPASEARNPGSTKQSGGRKNEEVKPSTQRTSGTSSQQPSQHRKPSGRMESHHEVAASREPDKHITRWEADQQIKKRNANPSPEMVKRSESRQPKAKESKQRK